MWILSWMPKLDTKFSGLERRMDQMIGLHQIRFDKHDAELASQRQLLEDLRAEITLLRGGSTGAGPSVSDSPCVSPSSVGLSASSYVWQPQNVLVRGWAPFGSSAKTDRVEYKKLSEDLLPDCLRNQVVLRAPFAANYQLVLGVKGGGRAQCKEIRDVLSLEVQHNGMHNQRS